MPLTNAEKQKRYRQTLIEKHEADTIKNKDTARKKQKREENLTASREKERIRQQKYRASKAGKISKSPTFKSKTTLTKAVKQASEALPKSPQKQSVVVQKLLFQINMAEYAEPLSGTGRRGISAEVEKCVKKFYERCNNSHEAPGKQDTIKVTIDGSKITCQKKHLHCTIDELFNLFKEKYPNIKITRSKFAELRPPYVLPSSAMPTRACVCHYHENFKLLLDELHKVNKTILTYLKEFVNSLVCNPESKLCWKNLGLLCGKKMSATQQL